MTYDQGDRVVILVVDLITLMFFFRITIFISIIPFECWDMADVWENRPYSASPFFMYVAILDSIESYGNGEGVTAVQ
ncbi:hypothetical protein [Teredinibacter purpureus]|uniref:hypothetical protein n=1 Tax=Teredinibacter purpureus TaxID=2731756 RepID=UPI0005F7B34B|nr:hypothetical protein [Teredinibacter purpureus]